MPNDDSLELNAILENSRGNIIIADANSIVLRASTNNASIYGLQQKALIGASLATLENEGILNPSVSMQVIRTGKEAHLLQQTVQGRILMAEGYPVFDDQQKLYRVISFATDHTEIQLLRKEYEWLQSQFMQPAEKATSPAKGFLKLPSRSPVIEKIYTLLERVSTSDASILFLGESGVGKTAFSKLVHDLSDRSQGPFIEVNCSTIPESLFESEIFGYAPGAFTGANKKGKAGLIEQADGGTLFLDEIGELPLAMQSKLLSVLQDGKLHRVGSNKSQLINFRLISATNQNLKQHVTDGSFRLDLFYRINVIPIIIPSLRDRIEDIPLLLDHILDRLNQRYGENKMLSNTLRQQFIVNDWPGNIRELENTMERSYLASAGDTLQPFDDFSSIGHEDQSTIAQGNEDIQIMPVKIGSRSLNEALDIVEKQLIEDALQHCKGTYELARYLGISQPTASRKLKKHGLN